MKLHSSPHFFFLTLYIPQVSHEVNIAEIYIFKEFMFMERHVKKVKTIPLHFIGNFIMPQTLQLGVGGRNSPKI